jgi:hypothetical protein
MAAGTEPKDHEVSADFSFEDYRSIPHHAALAAAQADLSAQFPAGTELWRITDFFVEMGGNYGWYGKPKRSDLTYCRYAQQISGLSADGIQWKAAIHWAVRIYFDEEEQTITYLGVTRRLIAP